VLGKILKTSVLKKTTVGTIVMILNLLQELKLKPHIITEPYAVKGMEVVELGIIFYIDTVFDSIDVGEYFWELEKYLEPYLGKDNFKIKLLNVINENPRANW